LSYTLLDMKQLVKYRNIHIIHININLFLHELPFSKTKINLVIHRSHNGLVTVTKIKIYLRLFSQGVAFDLLSAHQIHFQLFFEVKKHGKFPNA